MQHMRKEFQSTRPGGLRFDSFPYQLYQKAKRAGTWNPGSIDFSKDKKDWERMTEQQREEIRARSSSFLAGEEAVTVDLLPLIMVIAKEGRLEEEMYLTTFLFDEAKHTEFFRLFLNEIGETDDLSRYHSPAYRKIFNEMLPESMNRLLHDASPEAIVDAATTYNMFVEGVLAETGYASFHEGLDKSGLMPGLMEGIGYLKLDESRHISYGTYLLQRLIHEKPSLFDRFVKKMEELAPYGMEIVSRYQEGISPLGVDMKKIRRFAEKQINVRIEILSRAKNGTFDPTSPDPLSSDGL